MPSINQSTNYMTPAQNGAEANKLLQGILVDLTALKTSLNQLITDYNANATIATDTTAAAVTLTTTA